MPVRRRCNMLLHAVLLCCLRLQRGELRAMAPPHQPSRSVEVDAVWHAPLRPPWELARPGDMGALFMGRCGL